MKKNIFVKVSIKIINIVINLQNILNVTIITVKFTQKKEIIKFLTLEHIPSINYLLKN